MTQGATKLRAIQRWREDLTGSGGDDLPRFNIDLACHIDGDGRLHGDAALFLAFRNLDLPRRVSGSALDYNQDVATWMSRQDSAAVITAFTGIKIEDARQLVEPRLLWETDFDLASLRGREFVNVLDGYLATGIVDWQRVIDARRVAAAKAERKRQRKLQPAGAESDADADSEVAA